MNSDPSVAPSTGSTRSAPSGSAATARSSKPRIHPATCGSRASRSTAMCPTPRKGTATANSHRASAAPAGGCGAGWTAWPGCPRRPVAARTCIASPRRASTPSLRARARPSRAQPSQPGVICAAAASRTCATRWYAANWPADSAGVPCCRASSARAASTCAAASRCNATARLKCADADATPPPSTYADPRTDVTASLPTVPMRHGCVVAAGSDISSMTRPVTSTRRLRTALRIGGRRGELGRVRRSRP